ncbi:MAG: mannose-1-phosphate guanylyltransferase/mannose-6-phosphate isomerase [Hydrogenothermaceae bacterium]|nr:mannose-1-phosphate guanylyltransferase/mannose-6-phosphate isomerase [Hydrogenothermaceae bacterium]
MVLSGREWNKKEMKMMTVILSGGSGTRLYPFSREKFPKQFLNFGDRESLFQKTVKRNIKISDSILIVANKEYRFHILQQLKDITESKKFNLILEPVGKNTAPAIALAIKYVTEKLGSDKDEILFISPSDHIISPEDEFMKYVSEAKEIAKEGYIVTFGVNPTKPETGYGYIEVDTENSINGAFKVKQFHEKPDLETARNYLMNGNYYWNSGMFTFSIKTIIDEFKVHSPEIYDFINNKSFEEMLESFNDMPNISIDYAIMEKTDKTVMLPLFLKWSDVGSWDSIYDILDKDENQNVKIGNVVDIDTENSLILSKDRLVATVGLEDVMILETADVVVVAKRGEGQKIKDLVSILKKRDDTKYLTEFHTTVYRPWGSYTELEKGERYKIKRITVNPGESLSLQMHHHRSEHWIVVKGTAKVIIEYNDGNKVEKFIHENESIYVPKSTKHRLVNPGKIPLEIIEVQVGEYVEEDDIIRFDDIYGR